MSKYKVACVGCSGSFDLKCNNCKKYDFEITDDKLICNNCKEKTNKVKCNVSGFFSDPCGASTKFSSTPEKFSQC
jgi:hypothetical protein